jgi:hypothetical protein
MLEFARSQLKARLGLPEKDPVKKAPVKTIVKSPAKAPTKTPAKKATK